MPDPHRSAARAMAVVAAVVLGVVGYQTWGPSPGASRSPTGPSAEVPSLADPVASVAGAPPGPLPARRDAQGSLGLADGAVPDGVTVLDDVPAVANLDGDLRVALRRAAADASGDGVELAVNSGWRSPAYQAELLREAIAKYGSEKEATRWVATPETSEHVQGEAVDLGSGGAAWLADHGSAYGLCRVYDNEPWHFELRPDAVDQGCPRRYEDAAHDPRLQS